MIFSTFSYKPIGFTWSQDTHSSEPRTYLRTDLAHFTPWVTFGFEIHHAITTRMTAMNIASDAEYDIGFMPKKRRLRIVENEAVCYQACTRRNYSYTIWLKRCWVYLGLMGGFPCLALGLLGSLTFLGCGIPLSIQRLRYVSLISVFENSHSYGTGGIQDKMGGASSRLSWVFSAQ
jgi:hypothetical protein